MFDKKTRLRTMRLEAGLSQAQLMNKLGYAWVSDLSKAENGGYVKPGFRRKLAAFFQVEEADLFDKDGFAK